MIIRVDIRDFLWFYYYFDGNGFKTTTEGFSTHIEAEKHARDRFGNDVEFQYN